MTVKRYKNRTRRIKEPEFNPYKDSLPESWNREYPLVVKGIFPKAIMNKFSMHKCCVCGYYEHHGVKVGSGFVCIRDFENDGLFFNEKVIQKNGMHIHPSRTLENWCLA